MFYCGQYIIAECGRGEAIAGLTADLIADGFERNTAPRAACTRRVGEMSEPRCVGWEDEHDGVRAPFVRFVEPHAACGDVADGMRKESRY